MPKWNRVRCVVKLTVLLPKLYSVFLLLHVSRILRLGVLWYKINVLCCVVSIVEILRLSQQPPPPSHSCLHVVCCLKQRVFGVIPHENWLYVVRSCVLCCVEFIIVGLWEWAGTPVLLSASSVLPETAGTLRSSTGGVAPVMEHSAAVPTNHYTTIEGEDDLTHITDLTDETFALTCLKQNKTKMDFILLVAF